MPGPGAAPTWYYALLERLRQSGEQRAPTRADFNEEAKAGALGTAIDAYGRLDLSRVPNVVHGLDALLGHLPMQEDVPYLRQFIAPSKNYLPQTTMRPTHADPGFGEGMPWRRTEWPENMVTGIKVDEDINPATLTAPKRADMSYQHLASKGDPWKSRTPGLGNFKASIGRDDKGPYLSVLDKWDFDSEQVGPIARYLMNLIGEPYVVYDRFDLPEYKDLQKGMNYVEVKRRKEP